MTIPSRGVLVMAYGPREYQRQALHLGLSLQRHSPDLARTLVTDQPEGCASRAYNTVIPLRHPPTSDCRYKLDLDVYTPYRYTLYLDADTLAVRDLTFVFDEFEGEDVAVLGRNVVDGHWYGDVIQLRGLTGSSTLPKINSGMIYFADTARTHAVFDHARQLSASYDNLGLDRFRGGIADEPLLSVALARHGIPASEPKPSYAGSLLGVSSPIRLNTITGQCSFDKKGIPRAPALVHFVADFSSRYQLAGAHYRRECLRLRVAASRFGSTVLSSLAAHLLHGFPCAIVNFALAVRGRAPGEPRSGPREASW